MKISHLHCEKCDRDFPLKKSREVTGNEKFPNCPKCGVALALPMANVEVLSDESNLIAPVLSSDSSAVTSLQGSDVQQTKSIISRGFILVILSLCGMTAAVVVAFLSFYSNLAKNDISASRSADIPPSLESRIDELDFSSSPSGGITPFARKPPNSQLPGYSDGDENGSSRDKSYEVLGRELPELHYCWKPGHNYRYQLSLEVAFERGSESLSSFCSFTSGPTWEELTNTDETENGGANSDAGEELIEASGSGFVVSRDGYLITCAHVVENAERIAVKLNGEVTPARIVVTDFDHDLALLKIDRQDLQPLSFCDVSDVQIGQDVRVVGFPLSSLLQEHLNVTRGTVSGILLQDDNKILQVDAPINPGNSGGPLVNSKGQVIGVATAKLANVSISEVGFAASIEDVMNLLEHAEVPQPDAEAVESLSGPELVQRVSPGVALLKVWVSSREPNLTELRYYSRTDARAIASVGIRWADGKFTEKGTWEVNPFGFSPEPIKDLLLPFVWETPTAIVMEQLDPYGRDFWLYEEDVSVLVGPQLNSDHRSRSRFEQAGSNAHFSRFGNFPRPHTFHMGQEEGSPTRYEGTVSKTYKIVKEEDKLLTIAKQYQWTAKDEKTLPAFELSGRGILLFSTKEGVPEEYVMKYDCKWLRNGYELEFPISVRYIRIKPELVKDQELDNALTHFRSIKKTREEKMKRAQYTHAEELKEVLNKIRKSVREDRVSFKELHQLNELPVIETYRKEVMEVLGEVVERNDSQVDYPTSEALKSWATSEDVPWLLGLLEEARADEARYVVEVLARFRDARAIDPLISALEMASNDHFHCSTIGEALAAIGPAAEDKVIPLLKHKSDEVVEAACEYLQECGTAKSEKPLKDLLGSLSRRNMVRFDVERALESVQESRSRSSPRWMMRHRMREAQAKKIVDGEVNTNERSIARAFSTLSSAKKANSATDTALRSLAECVPVDRHRKKAVALILPYLEDAKDVRSTKAAIQAIGVWGDSSHTERIEKLLLVAKFPATRELIFNALGKIGDENTSKRMMPYLSDPTDGFLAASAFRKLSEDTEKQVVSMLSRRDVYQRAKAVTVLGNAGSEQGVKAIEFFLEMEPDTIARQQAIVALAKWRVENEE